MEEGEKDPIALHVIVVGFHHKKGMQVEYSYPPLTKDNSCDLPEQWRHLPSLCLPDGASQSRGGHHIFSFATSHKARSNCIWSLLL
ncbi:late secretory pathway protein avl9 [Halocaridina rubra]|uniref:Late secretory pathway protein avl9 n=1 Tax=Halocaridina rubra TaxID=373956 RepID=A0AAN8WND9_HALRR